MIYNRLMKIQQELKSPKGQFNAFGKYKYRSCEDILETVKPLLSKHECAITLSDDLVNIGSRYYIKATARLFTDKEVIEVTAFAREEETKKGMDGSQITGASSSYARKYALNGLLAIDDTKDSDGTNSHDKETPAELPKCTRDLMEETKDIDTKEKYLEWEKTLITEEDRKAAYAVKGQVQYRLTKLMIDNVINKITKATNEKTFYTIEQVISEEQDLTRKQELIDNYHKMLEARGFEHRYTPTPFEDMKK